MPENNLPTLYALNRDGTYQVWNVRVEGSEIVVEFGKENGKMQYKRTKCFAKNIGKKNETTDTEQAVLEAKSKWEKQVRLGYRVSKNDLTKTQDFSPMLAHDAIKRKNSLVYPVHVQPKLDGVRALVLVGDDGVPVFNSRGNKTYPVQGQLLDQMSKLAKKTGLKMFDGELYIHGLSLQKIVSLAKKWRTPEEIECEIEKDYQSDIKRFEKAINNGDEFWKDSEGLEHPITKKPEKNANKYCGYSSLDLEYHIFDIPSEDDTPWMSSDTDKCRFNNLQKVSEYTWPYNLIKVVHGAIVSGEDRVKMLIGEFMEVGYEGVVIRNFHGKYEFGQRSSDLQKWKLFQDGEAKVLDSFEDKNGEGVLLCVEKDGTQFNCKMRGTHEERSQENMKKLIGKHITFTYQARTDDGVPQFPVGKCVREVDSLTWDPMY